MPWWSIWGGGVHGPALPWFFVRPSQNEDSGSSFAQSGKNNASEASVGQGFQKVPVSGQRWERKFGVGLATPHRAPPALAAILGLHHSEWGLLGVSWVWFPHSAPCGFAALFVGRAL